MKPERIVANDIKKSHPRQKSHSTDITTSGWPTSCRTVC